MLVVLCHAGVPLFGGGYVGVDVFFVISGFLITGWLVRRVERDGRVPFAAFYAARARRILPAAALVLVVTAIASRFLLNYVRALSTLHDCVWATFFAANVHFARVGTDYFSQTDPPSPVQQFWTLAVEEQFYLAWPALLAVLLLGVRLWRGGSALAPQNRAYLTAAVGGLVGVSFAWSCWLTPHEQTLAYFSTLTRGWELGVGALLALAAPRIGARAARHDGLLVALGLGGIAVSTLAYSASTSFPGYAALLPVASTAVILAAGIERRRRSRAVRVLESRPFVVVGDVSYSFYLWHWPVLVIAAEYVGHPLTLTANLALVGLAFAVSVVTTRWFEDPIRHSRRLAPPRLCLVLWPITVSATLLVVATSTHAIHDRLDRIADSIHPEALAVATRRVQHEATVAAPHLTPAEALVAWSASSRRAEKPVPDALSPLVQDLAGDIFPLGDCGASGSDTSSDVCRFGDTAAKRTIGVYGDSHAQMWMPGIIRYAKAHGYAVVPLTKDGCATAKWLHPDPSDDCAGWSSWAIGRLRGVHPDLVVVGESYSDAWRAGNEGPQAEAGLAKELAALRQITPRIVLIGDPPNLRREPTDCLLAVDATLGSCTFPVSNAAQEDEQSASTAAGAGADYLPTLRWFCTADRCPTVVGTTVAYRDSNHITRTYATQLSRPFAAALGAAVSGQRVP
jgi:peptidoglycan/LPS O-acetylase OafA/YrhL